MKSRATHLIFDFDGTLADTFHYLVEINNTLAREFNFKTITDAEAKDLKNHSVLEIIKKLGVPVSKLPRIVQRAQEELHNDIHEVQLFEGLNVILTEMKKLGYRMGIITTNSAQNVKKFLKNHKIEIFDFITTCPKIWGKNKALKKLLKEQGLDAHQACYIGDETRDIEAAKKAGIKIAAVSWGYNTAEALAKHKPDFLIHSPDELQTLFDKSLNS